LSLSGDKKVGFLARDVDRVEVEIGRVLPSQVQHLAPDMWDFAKPGIGQDMQDRIVERFTTVRDYSGKQPGKPSYDSVDLGQYLQGKTQANRGLFLLRIRPAPPKKDSDQDEEPEADNTGDYQGAPGPVDARLILVTDLGFIVKQAKDGGRDVFVQSIRTGLPIEGARIEVSGRNGQAVLAATTDSGGRSCRSSRG
jgi:uncharacterized protein YfaS (alpha-2-macroglobulin family)